MTPTLSNLALIGSAACFFQLAAPAIAASAEEAPAGRIVARWAFDEGTGETTSGGSEPAPAGRIVKASWGEGRSGKGLVFEDYSLKNYLKPDVKEATRVVIPHSEVLNPAGPFTLKAAVYPTRDPLYSGGIFEKGRGFGASYRLLLIRGLKVRAAAGPAHLSVTSAEALSLNEWHTIEMTYDGAALVLKVDGKEHGRAAVGKLSLTNREDAVIGERFSGRIDEVSLHLP